MIHLMTLVDSNFMEGVKSFFGSDEKKELVDPYFLFSFAGKEIKSKVMYNSDHPEWNQELRLGLRVNNSLLYFSDDFNNSYSKYD